jgi:hypothetical protein
MRDDDIDNIFDLFDDLMKAGKFGQIDTLLLHVHPRWCDIDFVLAILTSTLPAKSLLKNRPYFIKRAILNVEYTHGIFSGLD